MLAALGQITISIEIADRLRFASRLLLIPTTGSSPPTAPLPLLAPWEQIDWEQVEVYAAMADGSALPEIEIHLIFLDSKCPNDLVHIRALERDRS